MGTFILDADAYRQGATKLAAFANRLRTELGIELEWIDLGGGFASTSRLKSQYLPGEQVSPSLGQYAEAIVEGLQNIDAPHDKLPLLILETGRALVDESGTMVTTVVASKRFADGRRATVIDAGVNVLFTAFWYKLDLVPTKPVSGLPEPTTVYGPLCMNIDVVRDTMLLPPLPVGSRVLIKTVGAYNVTQSMQFIELRPAVVMIGLDGQHEVIRRAETVEDLVRPESVPSWLK